MSACATEIVAAVQREKNKRHAAASRREHYTEISAFAMNTYVKFGVLMVLIVGSLAWLAVGGIKDTQTYYKTISELQKMGPKAHT
ncbi:MAG: hypothetical protein ACRD6B_13210, partial [Bryobacteraceae bacterium]